MTIVVASESFAKGYASDIPRDQLPPGYAYRMKDWIPSLDGRLRRRAGWTFTSPATAFAGSLQAIAWAPFAGDEHLVIIDASGTVRLDRVFDGVNSVAVTGTALAGITHPPIWHKNLNGLVIIGPYALPSFAHVRLAPKKYTQTGAGPPPTYTLAALGGTPPLASAGASWGDYLLLANGTVGAASFANRIWLSGVGAPETWATGTDFWDSVIPSITRVMPVPHGILVFGYDSISLIQGDIPPAGGNWSETIAFGEVGCMDARCVARYGELVVFAHQSGVYVTDGVTLKDLTLQCGLKQRWIEQAGGLNYANNQFAAGDVFNDKYIISFGSLGTPLTTMVFDLLRNVAYDLGNISVRMYAHRIADEGTATVTAGQMLFGARQSGLQVIGLHPMWVGAGTAADSPTDADGTSILPTLETPFYKLGGATKKVFRSMRATYQLTPNANTPTINVDYITNIDGAYTAAGALPTAALEDRQRVDIRDRGLGIGLRLTQVGSSNRTTLSEIEFDQSNLEGMR